MSTSARSSIKGVIDVNGPRYLVEELTTPEVKTQAGIIIPDTAKEDWTKYGRIAAVGDGHYTDDGKYHPCKYEVGEVIFFDRYTGKTVVGGRDFRIVPEEHALFRVDPAELGVKL